MPNFLEYLRQQNIFGVPPLMGNDLPQQGGITGRMSLPPGPNTMMDVMGAADPTQFMPPPQFDADTNYLANIQQPTFGSTDITQSPSGMDISQFTQPIPNPDEMDAGRRMGELYNPKTEATDRFNELARQYPQAKDPSWLRRIGAMVVDYTKGGKAGQDFYERPHTRAVEDWKNQVSPAYQAASLERYENVNNRTVAYNQISAELREKAQQAKDKNDTRNAEIRQQRADIYAFKATHPNWKIMMPKGGNIIAINPQTGESQDTGIPTGSMTDLDRINLQGEQRLDQIAATGEQTRETEGVRQAGREAAIRARGEETRKTRETVPGGSAAGKPLLPTQVKVDQYNKARQLMNSRPDLAKYIQVTGTNEFTIAKPGTNFWGKPSGPTPNEYSEIINAIYGTIPQGQGKGGRGSMAGPGPGVKTPPAAPKGWKYVAKPGGGWTAVKDTGVQ